MQADLLNLEELMVAYCFTLGNLALSRALGDFEFKNNTLLKPEDQIVTAEPDIIERSYNSDDEFMVIACDGNCLLIFRNMGLYVKSRCN